MPDFKRSAHKARPLGRLSFSRGGTTKGELKNQTLNSSRQKDTEESV